MKVLTWGICLVVFCLPLYLLRFEVFGIPTTVLEMMLYSLFIIWLFNKSKDQLFLRSEKKLIFIAIGLIFIGASLATIFSSNLRASAGIWKAWFVDPLLFFIVIISIIKNSEQIRKIFCSLFLSGTVVAIISLVYLIQGNLDPVGRLQAFYNSPNYLAMYLAPALIIGFGLWIIAKKQLVKILLITDYLLLVTCLFFTKSFGAWLGIIAAIGIGLIIYLFKSRKKLAWIILVLTLIVILALGYFALIQRPSSFETRMVIWQKALQVFKTNPILGIGPGTFENYAGVPQPHNIFLAFLLQTGIVGFIGFIWLLIYFYKKRTSVVLTMVMTYILVHGLVDTTYWKNDLAIIFWLIIALYYIINHLPYLQRKGNLLMGKGINQQHQKFPLLFPRVLKVWIFRRFPGLFSKTRHRL